MSLVDLWSNLYPQSGGSIVIPSGTEVLLDVDAQVARLEIAEGASLTFDPAASRKLESLGNIVVAGTLSCRPSEDGFTHMIDFVNVDESAFVGGDTMAPLETDVGLWVTQTGVLDLVGSYRAPWSREDDDSWLSTDELVAAPVQTKDNALQHMLFDMAYQKGDPIPVYTSPSGWSRVTEILNLTRNVVIRASGGRAHVIFLMNDRRQTIEYVSIEHMGPTGVLSRYGLHWHHCRDGSRGSVIRGVVVRDGGNRAYVPHASHGIIFEDCIAYEISGAADEGQGWWWDPDTAASYPSNATDDTRIHRCFAGACDRYGFELRQGVGNEIGGCVAVGCDRGFAWPGEIAQLPAVWRFDAIPAVEPWGAFEQNIAHNCLNGVRVWQNTPIRHEVSRFISYNHNQQGVVHGAYGNAYVIRDATIIGSFKPQMAGLDLHAVAVDPQSGASALRPRMERLDIRDCTYGIRIYQHVGPDVLNPEAVLIGDCRISGSLVADVYVAEGNNRPGRYDFLRLRINGEWATVQDITIASIHPDSVYRFEDEAGACWQYDTQAAQWVALPQGAVSAEWE